MLGNHDYLQRKIGADLIAAELARQGVTVLRNDLTAFVHDGVAGIVVGFEDDLEGPGADVKGIVARMQGKSPSIVLVHEPDAIDRFPDRWSPLTLSGHTHGAQMRLSPIRTVDWIDWPVTEMQSDYPRGWFDVRGNRLYVSHGLGVSRWPHPLLRPPRTRLLHPHSLHARQRLASIKSIPESDFKPLRNARCSCISQT